MRLAFLIISLIVAAIAGLAVLIVLAGAVAALFARWRREREARTIDVLAFCFIGAAGLIVTGVAVLVACAWSTISGKPLPPPPRFG